MSSPRNLYNELLVGAGLVAGDSGGTVTSFDRFNAGNPAQDLVAALVVGTVTGTVTATLVESASTDVASAMDAVDTSEVQGGNPLVLTTANDNQTHYRGYLGNKRYVGFSIDGDFAATVLFAAADPRANVR